VPSPEQLDAVRSADDPWDLFCDLLGKIVARYPNSRLNECIDGIIRGVEEDDPMLSAWFGFVAGLHCRDALLCELLPKTQPFVETGARSLRALEKGRVVKAEKKTVQDAAVRAAVQKKLDAGLSLNAAQRRVADERAAQDPPSPPSSFMQVWRITRGMRTKKKNRK
jgi:hypothetical protein